MTTTIEPLRFGRPPDVRDPRYAGSPHRFLEDLSRWINDVARKLENYSDVKDRPVNDAYTVTNLTTRRTLDADTVTLAELADVVGTFLTDMDTKGQIQVE